MILKNLLESHADLRFISSWYAVQYILYEDDLE